VGIPAGSGAQDGDDLVRDALPINVEVGRPLVEKGEPGCVRRLDRALEHLGVEGTPETVRGEDVEAGVAHERRRAGHGVEHALDARPDPLPPPPTPRRGRRLRRTGEIEEVRALGLVQVKSAGQGLQHTLGHPAQVSALEAGVVVDADPGNDRDFLPAESGNAPLTVCGDSRLLWRDPGSPGGEELADLALRVHERRVTPPSRHWEALPVPGSTGTLGRARSVLFSAPVNGYRKERTS
jgi:hypothetical protein